MTVNGPKKNRTPSACEDDFGDSEGECLISPLPSELSGCKAEEACICGSAMARED